MKVGLVGPTSEMRSKPFDAQRTINLIPVVDQQGKEVASLFGAPGLALFCTLSQGNGRKTFCAANERAFVVSGTKLYEVNSLGVSTEQGTLGQSNGHVSIAETDIQMAVCDGTSVFIFTYATNKFVKVSSGLPDTVSYVTSIDGYFIAIERNSGRFFKSRLRDGLTWDALDYATAESNPDKLLAAAVCGGQLYLIGTLTFEVWSNTGNATFTLQKISGAVGDIGIIATFTILKVDNTLLWVGRDKDGRGIVYRVQGIRQKRVSTEAIEKLLQDVDTPEQLFAYSYQRDGHLYYIISGGGLETSLCYDITTDLWTERAHKSENGSLEPHLAADCMFAFGKHLICDRKSSNIYEMSDKYTSDAGTEIIRKRIFTHISDENKMIRYNRLEIGVEAGVGNQTEPGQNPLISLRLSRDGARTWSDRRMSPIGRAGQFLNKAVFRSLGTATQMTFEVTITDPVKVSMTGAYLS